MNRTIAKSILFAIGSVVLCSSGCAIVTAPARLAKSLQKKDQLQQIAYEEEIVELPSELQEPEKLKIAYARWMEDMKQHGEAQKKYQEVLQVEPDNFEAILGLARIDLEYDNFGDAEQKLKRAVKVAPDSHEVQYTLGEYYVSQRNWQAAIEPLTEAMLKAPNHQAYRFQLAVALVHVGDVGSAMPHFIQTVGDAEAHFNVAMILKDRGDFSDAEKHLRLAIAKNPEFDQAKHWLNQLRSGGTNQVKLSGHQAAARRSTHSFSGTAAATR